MGDKLGEITSELSPSENISKFLSGGAKNYAYRCRRTTVEKKMCKMRGINLNYYASKMVNIEVISDMILRGKRMNLTL